MSKMETIQEITRLNPSADQRFLFDFSDAELADYLRQLRRLREELGGEELLQPLEQEY